MLRNDLSFLWQAYAKLKVVLPSPVQFSDAWLDFVRNRRNEFVDEVHAIFYSESVCDRSVIHSELTRAFVCDQCSGKAFSTLKALSQHRRLVHKDQVQIRAFVAVMARVSRVTKYFQHDCGSSHT